MTRQSASTASYANEVARSETAFPTTMRLPPKRNNRSTNSQWYMAQGDKYMRHLCMNCLDPTCASVCPVGAMQKTAEGPVTYDVTRCIGCRYCMVACPFSVPKYEWDKTNPRVRKCDMCADRVRAGQQTACADACPTGATKFGERDALIAEARDRIAQNPGQYINHIYGLEEVGGTSVLLLSSVPFANFGYPGEPEQRTDAYSDLPGIGTRPRRTHVGLAVTRRDLVDYKPARRSSSCRSGSFGFSLATRTVKVEMGTKMSWPRITFWRVVLGAFLMAGFCATVLRFARGLGAATHLSDAFPWGLWVGFDVLCGVMLAAGGFTLTATVYIFHLEKFRPIIRPTVLTAFMGYLLVIVALFYDLGRGWFIWHAIIMWNPRSVMFEVAWCVMLYTTVLTLEFAPILFERLRLEKLLRIQHAIVIPLVILGVLLSTLHQSSLGSLYLIMPSKLYPLWYTPWLPVFFFLSAICVGLAMTIFESSLSSKHFGKQLELSLLRSLGRVLLVTLLLYAGDAVPGLVPSRSVEAAGDAELRDQDVPFGSHSRTDPAYPAFNDSHGSRKCRRPVPLRRVGDPRIHHQPLECGDYRDGSVCRRTLLSEVE